MQCSLAICVATYERPELIRDFLEKCAAYYAEAGVDVYFYDSSKSDETEKLVLSWPEQEHVFYVRIPSDVPLSEKMLMILQQYGLNRSYDFVCLSNDSTQYSKDAIKYLMEKLNMRFDYVIYQYRYSGVIKNPRKLLNCGADAQHLGASFLNVRTMLTGVDWSSYESLFIQNERGKVWEKMGSSFAFYFCRILELEHFEALALKFDKYKTMRWTSQYKKETIYDQGIMRWLCESWIWTYGKLPNYYKNKWRVCRQAASICVTGRVSDFMLYRRKGEYSPEIYKEYLHVWNKVTKIPKPVLWAIATIPQSILVSIYDKRRDCYREKLIQFCKAHDKIIIYGAGTNGAIAGEYLKLLGIEYDAYCVTREKSLRPSLNDHPVILFSSLAKADIDKTGFIITMRESGSKEVLKAIRNKVKPENCFYYPDFMRVIREEMGYASNSVHIK